MDLKEEILNPFERNTGSDRIRHPWFLALLFFLVATAALITSQLGFIGGLALAVFPFILFYLLILFNRPVTGIFTAIVLGFVLIGAGRYLGSIPVGLGMDAIITLSFIALVINKFRERVDWKPVKKDVTFLAAVWFGYSLFQIVNPEAQSFSAWFSGRGIAFYMLTLVPLTLLLIDNNRKLDTIFWIWGIMTILVALKGIMQIRMGVDPWERAWLDAGNAKTHILFGKLRAFSFLSDAGQFGANQAYSAVVAGIFAFSQDKLWKKTFFLVVAALGLYGLFISGTRGALSIPLAGFALFFLLRKNKLMLFSGALMLVAIFIFFKFTTIGQGNANIRRMRTAFDPNDASLQVRLENQRLLKTYMVSRPFGGGIGHGGVKAQRYLPDAYLSSIPTDSGYVLIWVEQGIVGLVLYIFILMYILIKSSFRIMFRIRDPVLRLKMAALASGMFGIMVANYGNAVLMQMPTSILIYISMALLLNSEKFDRGIPATKSSGTPEEIKSKAISPKIPLKG